MSWNKIIECVPNFSEGRDLEKIDQIVAPFRIKAGVKLLDYSNDEDHNRLVVTLVGEPEALYEAIVEAVGVAVRLIDLNQHTGQHPRMGAVDVIPFIPIKNTSMEEAIELTNAYAPEHLIIETEDYLSVAERIVNVGSVFLGSLTPESAGDYASGTNHTLPTNGYAKAYSGVSLDSFIRKITFQEIKPEGLNIIGPAIELMAANEQLDAHKNAVSVRLGQLENGNEN